MKYFVFLCTAFVVIAGCAKKQEEQQTRAEPSTPYGPRDTVAAYRKRIEPYIRAVTEAQNRVDRSVGSRGRVTAANLAKAMEAARPDLEAAYAGFRKLTPPAGLRSLHEKIGRLMACRLEAYSLAVDGWRREQTQDEADTLWRQQTQAKLAEANKLIGELNTELKAVDTAIQAAGPPRVATP